MPGKRITVQQIEIYMKNRDDGCSQELAAAKAGISERSGRRIEDNEGKISQEKRLWRTRQDPFEEVWEAEVIPMLTEGVHEATFILRQLQERYPGKFPDTMTRTLQRKIKFWKALFGKEKEVMFMQKHEPGKLGISDFTHPKEIKVTIRGEHLEHIFYHFRLPYSGFSYMTVFKGSGESFTALAQGLQEALHYIGGVPETHRTDSLSAAFKNLKKEAVEDLTNRYQALSEHYGMRATRINIGKGHENGAVESSHRHAKNKIHQSLIVRGSNDFASFEEYRDFVRDVIKRHNQRSAKNIDTERVTLKALPSTKATDYEEIVAVVSCASTIDVKRVTYTVPSRLISERLHVRLYNDRLECYLGNVHALTLERALSPAKGKRSRKVDYRHLIGSLVKKPGAFRGSMFRDDLLPDDNYRYIWERIDRKMNSNDACKFMVGLLHLAATQDCQNELAEEVIALLKSNRKLKLSELQDRFTKNKLEIPVCSVSQHSLSSYNSFIPNFQKVQ